MQVIAGKFKGQLLKTPKGKATRPTISKVKKSIFDMCMHELEDCHFLDLFAGSGQMGIEALSRGGSFSCFVEKGKEACHCLKNNIEKLKIKDHTELIPLTVERALPKLIKRGLCFDIIYLDPPYGSLEADKTLCLLDKSSLFHPQTRIFLEESSACKPSKLAHLMYIDERRFGDTSIFELRQRG